jgi:hypothetical protein
MQVKTETLLVVGKSFLGKNKLIIWTIKKICRATDSRVFVI